MLSIIENGTCHRIAVVPEPRRPTSIPTQQSSRTSGMAGVMQARIKRTSTGSDNEGASPVTMLSPSHFLRDFLWPNEMTQNAHDILLTLDQHTH